MTQNLKDLLTENGLSEYIGILEEQHLDSEELLADLNQSDFDKLGIKLIGDQKKFIRLFSIKDVTALNVVPYKKEAAPIDIYNAMINRYDDDDDDKQPNIVIQNNPNSGSGIHGAVGGIIGAIIGVIIAGVFIFWVIHKVLSLL
jgi:hypothetical protein